MDEAIRHSITKMAHLHFCATQSYKKRVIQLGEDPKRVFFVGGMGIDNIKKLSLLDKEAFEQSIDFKLAKRNLLVTFHPATLENNSSKKQFMELLKAIDSLQDTHTIFTKANSDKDGKIINTLIDNYVAKHPQTSVAFHSLGQLRYLSALQFVDVVVGNSSSGLLEVPSFQKATINIGERQKGREKAISVIDVAPKKEEICQALKQVQTPEFLHLLKRVTNPYDAGGTANKVKEILKEYPLENILKKEFYDCKC
jgi:GDP/UDP-N,N'-diacetylbacillosamine 2-epimerase (hydrolysing)